MEFIFFIPLLLLALMIFLYFKKIEQVHVLEKQVVELKTKESHLGESFKNLSSDIFHRNSQTFLDLAEAKLGKWQEGAKGDFKEKEKAIDDLVKPIKDSLEKYDKKIEEFQKDWRGHAIGLDIHLKTLDLSHKELKKETGNLTKALRQPHVRGRWGEFQLKKVVEMAGMLEYCDFVQQEASADRKSRPDMIVRLPNERQIVIDSKVPLQSYLDSLEADDEKIKHEMLVGHARQLKNHIQNLSQKSYWEQFNPTPEFVILFLPGETFFSAALEQDPHLIEMGVEQKVLLATPTTLIALLRSVAYGWRQEKIAKNAEEISQMGKDLYKRVLTLSTHFDGVRKGIESAVENYNKCASTLETRVLVSLRRFNEKGVHVEEEILEPKLIDKIPRTMVSNLPDKITIG